MAKSKWYQLDNAAKIVPSTTGGADTRVFRITCELKEDVDPDTLQSADVIIGPIANDTIYDTFGIITSGFLTHHQAKRLLIRLETTGTE